MTHVQLHRDTTAAVLVEVQPTGVVGQVSMIVRSVGPVPVDDEVGARILRDAIADFDLPPAAPETPDA